MTGRPCAAAPGSEFLTRLEELFLLAILQLDEPACLDNMRRYLLQHTGKDWAFGSLFVSLAKLERSGLVRTRYGAPKGGRGGKAIKYYAVTAEGLAALAEAKKLNDAMWRGFPAIARKAVSNER